jgi:hypothetical protein
MHGFNVLHLIEFEQVHPSFISEGGYLIIDLLAVCIDVVLVDELETIKD